MNTYAQDIGQWAAAIPQTGFDIPAHTAVSRRSSFTSSVASGSPAPSASSQQTSATSISSPSIEAPEHSLDFDSGFVPCNDLQQDSSKIWQQLLNSATQSNGGRQISGSQTVQKQFSSQQPGVAANAQAQWGHHFNKAHAQCARNSHNPHDSLRRAASSLWNHRSLLRDGKVSVASCAPVAFPAEGHRTVHSTSHPTSAVPSLCGPCAGACGQPAHRGQGHAHGIIAPQLPVGINPRRTSTSRCWSKPSLVRQEGRKEDFVLHLVESATQLVAHIWPASRTSTSQAAHRHGSHVITLSFFIQETLRRSRSTYSTLQVTLYYLCLLKTKRQMSTPQICGAGQSDSSSARALHCGRRMFLAALILASKYLQDRNYSTKAWSKITSLPVHEINANERAFLAAIDYSLYLPLETYNHWCTKVQECVEAAKFGGQCPWLNVIANMGNGKGLLTTSRKETSVSSGSLDAAAITPLDTASHDYAKGIYDKPNILAPETYTSQLPPSPTLSRTLTTPSISPWIANSSTPAASTPESHNVGGSRPYCSITTNPKAMQSLESYAQAPRPSVTGSQMAPVLAPSASLATTRTARDIETMCVDQVGNVASTVSVASVGGSLHRSTSPLHRIRAISRSSSTSSCHFPSPLRLGITQLPTPSITASSLNSVMTAPLDSPISPTGNSDVNSDDGSSAIVTNLLHRVALEAQKYGLGAYNDESSSFTLPPIKSTTACDSLRDINSQACSDLRWQSNMESTAPCARDNLPALAHILQHGLKEHLKPYMYRLRQQSASPVSSCPKGVKRGCVDDDDEALGRMAKVQRATTWH